MMKADIKKDMALLREKAQAGCEAKRCLHHSMAGPEEDAGEPQDEPEAVVDRFPFRRRKIHRRFPDAWMKARFFPESEGMRLELWPPPVDAWPRP
ncbi:hypothetical protein CTP10_R71470 (plasmid) [Cupriavidus sp. P-10]|uniref:hypothetical protein n=1 Tax=unclassified Cupriavidus TaxID=2640874 RepID=UPI0011C1303F|nr:MULTISPECIES: hypothetical protein [unclassified Cupriavidus]BDB29732.1 hypothetical protein CTP10_R71470 [Cupriavidus sp. P-10]